MALIWNRDFDQLLGEFCFGLQLCDLEEDDYAHIMEMKAAGMTPEEAMDVYREVRDVE